MAKSDKKKVEQEEDKGKNTEVVEETPTVDTPEEETKSVQKEVPKNTEKSPTDLFVYIGPTKALDKYLLTKKSIYKKEVYEEIVSKNEELKKLFISVDDLHKYKQKNKI